MKQTWQKLSQKLDGDELLILQALRDRKHFFIPSKEATCALCGCTVLAVDWTWHRIQDCQQAREAEDRRWQLQRTRRSSELLLPPLSPMPLHWPPPRVQARAPFEIVQASIYGCTKFKCSKCDKQFQLGKCCERYSNDVHSLWRAWKMHSEASLKCTMAASDGEPELKPAGLVDYPAACFTRSSSRDRTPSPE